MLWFGFMFATVIAMSSDRIMEDQSSATIVFRKIAVSGEGFDEQYVLQRCREFLVGNKNKKLVRYTLVPDEPGATVGWTGCDHCTPYPFWRMQYDAIAKEVFPIGEMIVLEGNAVVRYRNGKGTVTETMLTGANPRTVVIGGFKGNIVHVGMHGRMDFPMTLWLYLYVVGEGEISSNAGADYIALLSRQMGVRDATVQFRSDPWFISEIWRPWFPLFEQHRGIPPKKQEFDASKTLNCSVVWRPNGRRTNECSWKDVARLP
jgi:hypothetical protein